MTLLTFIRKLKANLLRLKFHVLFEPFVPFFLTLCYISKLSKWVKEAHLLEFNDFYSKHHDYHKRYDLYSHIIQSENLEQIFYIEFGVSEGHSFRWWIDNIKDENSRFAGFDTFTGLPENWGGFKKGEMSTAGTIPHVDDNRCEFVKGLFQETLPSFIIRNDSALRQRKVIHLDADVYSSTLFALTMIGPYLKKGDVLIFDEFNVPLHEFRAFTDFINSYYVKTSVIGAVNNYYQICFRIEENPTCYTDADERGPFTSSPSRS